MSFMMIWDTDMCIPWQEAQLAHSSSGEDSESEPEPEPRVRPLRHRSDDSEYQEADELPPVPSSPIPELPDIVPRFSMTPPLAEKVCFLYIHVSMLAYTLL